MTNFNTLLDNVDLEGFYMDDEDIAADLVEWDSLDTPDDEDEDGVDNGVVLSIKWIMDGADTLSEAAELLRNYAEFLDTLESDGYMLQETIEDGQGFAVVPNNI